LKLAGYLVGAYLVLRLAPSLNLALRSLEHVSWERVAGAIALEVPSETGFVVSWRAIIDLENVLQRDGPGRRMDDRVARTRLGGGLLATGGSLGGIGAGGWILHRFGMPTKLIAERQFDLSFLNTAGRAGVLGADRRTGAFEDRISLPSRSRRNRTLACEPDTPTRVNDHNRALCRSLRTRLKSGRVTGRAGIPTFPNALPQSRAAIAYAERMHAGQRRADGGPFILHPVEVASLLYSAGAPDHLIAAGVMHDLIEKTDVSAGDLRARFGPRITRLVLAVSDDDQISGYAKRKAALRQQVASAGDEALTLFAADKLSKLRELRRETAVDSESTATSGRVRELRARRLRHYRRSLALLEERLPESPLVRDLRGELTALLRERTTLALTH
jgi:hypothetical protein